MRFVIIRWNLYNCSSQHLAVNEFVTPILNLWGQFKTRPWTDTWFHVNMQAPVLCEAKLMESLEDIEAEAEDHTPLKFRPFIAQLLIKLRQDLQSNITMEMLHSVILGSLPGLRTWVRDNCEVSMVFPVQTKRLCRCCESNPPEFWSINKRHELSSESECQWVVWCLWASVM
jgi:hypothetical protein